MSNGSDDLNREVQSIWEQNAAFWDEAMGEGNAFQSILIGPAAERLLQIQSGETVLDIACGNGVFARRLAQLGAQVTACDFSQTFIERAREKSGAGAAQIEYRVLDATQRNQILSLGRQRFDAAYCGMAIQDMTEFEPLFSTLPELLKPNGRFVFSIPHPAFNNDYCRKLLEEEDREGELVVTKSIKVTGYNEPRTDLGLGIHGQPAAHYYFHRPLHLLYNTAFKYGFVLDGIEEPVFAPGREGHRPFSWENYPEIPPVLISRLRLNHQ